MPPMTGFGVVSESGQATQEIHARFVYQGGTIQAVSSARAAGELGLTLGASELPFSVSDVEDVFQQISSTFDVARWIAETLAGEDPDYTSIRFTYVALGRERVHAPPSLMVERLHLGSPLIALIAVGLPFARPSVLRAFIDVAHEAFTVPARIRSTTAQHRADELEALVRQQEAKNELTRLGARFLREETNRLLEPSSVDVWSGDEEPPLELPQIGPQG